MLPRGTRLASSSLIMPMPAQAARADSVVPAADAAPAFAFVVNCLSGAEREDRLELVRRLMDADGRPYHVESVQQRGAIGESVQRAVDWAAAHGAALVASGGDGTLNAVAGAALELGCPVGVVPQGTFNYFARAHGISTDPEEAVRQLLTARPQPVKVPRVNDRIFLINASLGLYPQLLQDREDFKRQHGRNRFNAMLSALLTILREHRQWTLELDLGGKEYVVRTATLFVGNNVLQLEQVGLPQAEAVARGALAAVMVKPVGRLAMLWLALRGALGTLGEADSIVDFAFRRMTVRPPPGRRPRKLRVAIDGEVTFLRTPLTFEVAPTPLRVLLPAPAPATPA
jgi:diacylglycerol kinase family enzyme